MKKWQSGFWILKTGTKKRNKEVYNFILSAIDDIKAGSDYSYALGAIEAAFIAEAITAEEREEMRKAAIYNWEAIKRANRTKREIIAEKLWGKFNN